MLRLPPTSYRQIGAAPAVGANGRESLSNAAGNTTLTIPAGALNHIAVISFSGATRTSAIILLVANRIEGDVVEIRLENPASAAITQELRNATAGGDIIYSCYSDDGNAYFRVYFDGSAFQPLTNQQPVA